MFFLFNVVLIKIDAVLTIFAATSYPYLIAYTSELYVDSSRSVTIMYFTIGLAALILSISTVWASFKSKTNYVLVVSTKLIGTNKQNNLVQFIG